MADSALAAILAAKRKVKLGDLGSAHLDLVVENGTSEEVAEWLRFPLEMALANGNVQVAQDLADAGANTGPGWKGRDGRSLLDAAALGGNVGALRIVLKGKDALDDLNTPSGDKSMVPLMRAIDGRHVDAARLLVNIGADVMATDIDGCTSLHHSLRVLSPEIAELLIVAGSDVNAKDLKGVTPTHLTISSCIGGADKLFYVLLKRKADVNAVDGERKSLVHYAAKYGKLAFLQDLLDAGAKPDTKNQWGNTPLFSAVFFKASVDTVSMLASRSDVNVNSTNQLGNTPIAQAISCHKDIYAVSALLDAGADIKS